MKSRNHSYPEISSFSDFRAEKEKLLYRRKLTEAKLNLSYHSLGRQFSFSNLYHTIARKVVLPQISHLLGLLIDRMEKKNTTGESTKAGENTV